MASPSLGLASPPLGLAPASLGLASPPLAPSALASALLVGRASVAWPPCALRKFEICRLTANHNREGKVRENANRFRLCHRPQPDGDVGIPGDASGSARPVRVDRRHPRRRRLWTRLAPRSLWWMPPDVQLPARLAFPAVRQALP